MRININIHIHGVRMHQFRLAWDSYLFNHYINVEFCFKTRSIKFGKCVSNHDNMIVTWLEWAKSCTWFMCQEGTLLSPYCTCVTGEGHTPGCLPSSLMWLDKRPSWRCWIPFSTLYEVEKVDELGRVFLWLCQRGLGRDIIQSFCIKMPRLGILDWG